MSDMELFSYQIKELSMVNDLKSSCEMKLVNLVSSDCKWNDEMAVITITETLRQCGHPDQFCIELKMEGRFQVNSVKNIADKKDIHSTGYQELLVYANEILSLLAKNSGIEGLDIQKSSLKPADINFGSQPDAVKQEKIIRLRPKDE